jgi:hypothetical protein
MTPSILGSLLGTGLSLPMILIAGGLVLLAVMM